MKKLVIFFSIFAIALIFVSCEKPTDSVEDQAISKDVLNLIEAAGFNNTGVTVDVNEFGTQLFRVEGCYEFTNDDLLQLVPADHAVRISEEQYSTYNLVTGLPRVITVKIDNKLPSSYGAALDIAINRYNAENLQITMQRISQGKADITITTGRGNYLASSGFPTSSGEPYSRVKVNSSYLGNNPGTNYLGTILAHEIGHCIGFRHTDYMDRSYSCGGSYYNEGSASVGAVHIPGTPTGPEPNSWMLSCIGNGDNRPFTNNDKTALDYLY